mgnify:CR=1 FL=1
MDRRLSSSYIPARNDMALPAGFPARSEIKLMDFNPAIALEQAEANKQKFADIFGAE